MSEIKITYGVLSEKVEDAKKLYKNKDIQSGMPNLRVKIGNQNMRPYTYIKDEVPKIEQFLKANKDKNLDILDKTKKYFDDLNDFINEINNNIQEVSKKDIFSKAKLPIKQRVLNFVEKYKKSNTK